MTRTSLVLVSSCALLFAGCGSSEEGSSVGTPALGQDAGAEAEAPLEAGHLDSVAEGAMDQEAEADLPEAAVFDAAAQLARYLEGRFDSEAQSKTQPSYWAIQLVMCPVAAPELGERVLYVEQARMDQPTNPYRQRLYVVEPLDPPDSRAVSKVLELEDPAAAVGLCDDPAMHSFVAADAIEREGCGVEMDWKGDHFEGGTVGEACSSTLNGASYTSSEVTLGATTLESWDRGFDDQGEQVWGATAGPYVFDRKTPL